MDLQTIAERLDQAPVYPYMSLCHVVVCTLDSRNELGPGSLYFSRKHPMLCWLSTMLAVFSSTILVNLLLNEPIISAFTNSHMIWASIIWYLIYYSPFDLTYKLCNILPLKMALYCCNELYLCKTIYHSILHAAKIFPDSYFIMSLVGIVKGNGPSLVRMFERLFYCRNPQSAPYWSMASQCNEFMHPSYSTKVSSIVSIVFIVNRYTEWLMISQPFVLFCTACTCIYLRIGAILMEITDPFAPIENLVCILVFGGIWDALAKAIMIDNHFRSSQQSGASSTPINQLLRDRGIGLKSETSMVNKNAVPPAI